MLKHEGWKALRYTLLVFIIFIVSACGANVNQNDISSEITEPINSTVESNEKETRDYVSDKGTIQIPVNPQRVVVAVDDFIGDLLTLGVTPLAVAGNDIKEHPYFKESLVNSEIVGDNTTVNFEKIASLKPDLILTYQEEVYSQLSKIAPTVFIPWGKYNYRERLVEFGKILNKEQEAEKWITDFDAKIEEKKKLLADVIAADKKVVIFEIAGKDLYLYGTSYGRGGEIIYNALGLHAPAIVEEAVAKEGWSQISLEAIPQYLGEADYIFQGFSRGEEQDKKDVLESPVWNSVSAVKAGNVFSYDVRSYYFSDAYALDKQLDEVVEKLLAIK
ncbi:ABC transporter substrate-binding protein [Paenibacillus sp. FSL H8-0548]|uniref:ABC transporter substrate-binding protein n=1 Tax=Paenibacillus sp. FSL H8-0548 TaxID=1920422 RepID=UPI002116B236|nr:ABC transporter substrate-binding protein [Paenibacillus sp. FSL H8-0548]